MVVEKAFTKGQTKLCVTNDMMILSNCGCDISIISMKDSNSRKDYNLPNTTCIRSLCIHKNGQLLTLDSSKGLLNSFQMSGDAEPTLIWTLNHFDGAYAVCTDEKSGLIYVTGKEKKLHIVSPEGRDASQN